MTIEYNGFAYAGFQRQSSTPRDNEGARSSTHNVGDDGPAPAASNKRKRQDSLQSFKSNKSKSKTPMTVQQRIEDALEQWTNLSITTLRVRGAGRTDKGVHASGQVVAFDIPLNLLKASDDYGELNNDETSSREVLSTQALPLLQEAYRVLCTGLQTKSNQQNDAADSTTSFLDHWQIRRAISTRLPSDIAIRSVWVWAGSFPFEARQGIACKTYAYKIRFRSLAHSIDMNGGAQTVHPICNAGPHLLRRIYDQNNVWLCPWPLDETILHTVCQQFVGIHDFHFFVHKDEHKKQPNGILECKEKDHTIDLLNFEVDLQADESTGQFHTIPSVYTATFTLKAKGFHRQMVRNLVGFVVDVARGIKTIDDIPILLRETALKTDVNTSAVNAAPSCGLSLETVLYKRNDFMQG
jgi:tRNA pseudouridine(38-40) synthase